MQHISMLRVDKAFSSSNFLLLAARLLLTPSAFQCMMFRALSFVLPVALLPDPLASQGLTEEPPVVEGGPFRGRGPGTAPALAVTTGRTPYLDKFESVVIFN